VFAAFRLSFVGPLVAPKRVFHGDFLLTRLRFRAEPQPPHHHKGVAALSLSESVQQLKARAQCALRDVAQAVTLRGMQTPLQLLLIASLLGVSTPAGAQSLVQVTPDKPAAFQISPFDPLSADFEVVVPPTATTMFVWTTGATDDISLNVEGYSEDWGMTDAYGPNTWLDESIRLSVAGADVLFPGTWTIHVSLAEGSMREGFPTGAAGTLHVSFPEPDHATLAPGQVLETELNADQGYRTILSLPADFAPARRSQWVVEAFSPISDIDLIVGPSAMPNTLDYPYAGSQRSINYERGTFQGRQAKDLAIHVFAYMDSEVRESIPVRVRLTEVLERQPVSLMPPLELPTAPGTNATPKSRAIDSTVAIFGPLGGGTGTLISSTGLVLTNAHVALARPASSTPAQRKKTRRTGFQPTYFAGFQRDPRLPVVPEVGLELIASREDLDLALLRITTTLDKRPIGSLNLPHMSWGDPKKLQLGDPVFALGFPMTGGLGTLVSITLTSGICSGFGEEAGSWTIKTDAGVHAGISGGALLDRDWQLVGIPASSITDANYAGGIGFAIPVTTVPKAWMQLIERTDLEVVLDALNAELPGDIKVFPGSTPLEWALLRADAAATAGDSLAAQTRLVHAGAAALGPLLAELASHDLRKQKGRLPAARLRRALDELMLGHAPMWSATLDEADSPELDQKLRADSDTVAELTQQWAAICQRPERWAELIGLRDGTHPEELARFEQLVGELPRPK